MSLSLLTQLFDVKMAMRRIDYDTLSHIKKIFVFINLCFYLLCITVICNLFTK